MKIIYRFGADMVFVSTDIVADDYQPKSGETFVAVPQGGLMPIKWTGAAWQQATQAEHEAYVKAQQAAYLAQHPDAAKQAGPSDQDKLNATTSLQLAQLLADSKKQDALNAQLTIGLAQVRAELQKDDTKAQAQA